MNLQRHSRCRGFTLVETLVALTLLSLIAIALFAAVRAGLRMTEAGERTAATNQDMRVISDLLAGTFTALVPLTSVQGGKRLPHMNGDATSVAIVVEAPARFRAGGLHEVTFEQVRERVGRDKTSALKMTRRLIHPDLIRKSTTSIDYTRVEPDDERILLASATVAFSYFGRERQRAEPRWHQEWQGRWGTPLLVRTAIVQNGVSWPEVVARPQVQKARFQNLRRGARSSDDEPDDSMSPAGAPSDLVPENFFDPATGLPAHPGPAANRSPDQSANEPVCGYESCTRSASNIS